MLERFAFEMCILAFAFLCFTNVCVNIKREVREGERNRMKETDRVRERRGNEKEIEREVGMGLERGKFYMVGKGERKIFFKRKRHKYIH